MLDIMRKNAQSWVVKVILGLIILVFVFWGVGGFNSDSPDIIVRVNDKPITLREFSEEYNRQMNIAKAQIPNLPDEYFKSEQLRHRIIDSLIDKALLLQEAANLGISVSVGDVQKAIMSLPAFQDDKGKFSLEKYNAILRNERLNRADFEKSVMDSILLEKMSNYIGSVAFVTEEEALANYRFIGEERKVDYLLFSSSDYMEQVNITEDQINDYYEKNKSDFTVPAKIDIQYLLLTPQILASRYNISEADIKSYYEHHPQEFTEEPKIRIRQILLAVEPGASESELTRIKEKADQIYNQAVKGKDFAQLAKANSDDISSDRGGDMGWISQKDLSESLANIVNSLKTGEVSKPFTTGAGLHIVKLIDKRGSRLKDFNEVHDQIKLDLAVDQAIKDLPGVLDKSIGDVLNGKSLQDIAAGLSLALADISSLQKDNAEKELGLSKDAVETLFLTPEGITVDRPLAVDNGYMLAKVVKVQPEHVAALADVKNRIITIMRTEEGLKVAEEKANHALQELNAGKTIASPKIEHSEFFSRQGGIRELGSAPGLLGAVFSSSDKNKWMGPYPVESGIVLAKLTDVRVPSTEQWNKIKDLVVQRFTAMKKETLFGEYLRDLKSKAKLEDYAPERLDRLFN